MSWDESKFIGENNAANGVDTSAVVANADGTVLERLEDINVKLGGGAAALRTTFSDSQAVEENAVQFFNIGVFDIDAGAIASGSIDITSISAVMQKSTGGGAFATGTIAQPTFSKANGSVYCAYQFIAADWVTGDMYKLVAYPGSPQRSTGQRPISRPVYGQTSSLKRRISIAPLMAS